MILKFGTQPDIIRVWLARVQNFKKTDQICCYCCSVPINWYLRSFQAMGGKSQSWETLVGTIPNWLILWHEPSLAWGREFIPNRQNIRYIIGWVSAVGISETTSLQAVSEASKNANHIQDMSVCFQLEVPQQSSVGSFFAWHIQHLLIYNACSIYALFSTPVVSTKSLYPHCYIQLPKSLCFFVEIMKTNPLLARILWAGVGEVWTR